MALLQAPAGPARDALLDLGVDLETARLELAAPSARGGRAPRGAPEISPATRERPRGLPRTRASGSATATSGPEHLLLALLRDATDPAAELLTRLGATPDDVEAAICDVLKRTDFARSL